MRKVLVTGAAALALSFGVVACGSSDDSSSSDDSGSTSGETLTKAEVVEQADALCAKFDVEVASGLDEAGINQQSTKEDFEAYVTDTIVPLYREQIEELRGLTPEDEADAEEYAAITDALETELDAVEENPESALGDTTPFPDSTAAAKDFGLEVCGAD